MSELAPAFVREVVALSKRRGIRPDHLLALMHFETGGTFSPSVRNPNGSATGLIQFIESTARGLGTSTAALARMSAVEQLVYVERYFAQVLPRGSSRLADVCMAVFYPAAIGMDLDAVLFRSGTAAYRANSGLDRSPRDGVITPREYVARVDALVPRYAFAAGDGRPVDGLPVLALVAGALLLVGLAW